MRRGIRTSQNQRRKGYFGKVADDHCFVYNCSDDTKPQADGAEMLFNNLQRRKSLPAAFHEQGPISFNCNRHNTILGNSSIGNGIKKRKCSIKAVKEEIWSKRFIIFVLVIFSIVVFALVFSMYTILTSHREGY